MEEQLPLMMSKLENLINKDGYIVSTKVMNALVCAAWAHGWYVGCAAEDTAWFGWLTGSHDVTAGRAGCMHVVVMTSFCSCVHVPYVHIAFRASVSTSINLISP